MKICSYMRKVSIIWPVLLKLRQSIWNVHIWMYLLFIGRWNASILFWQLGWVRGLPSHFIPNNKRALWMSMIPSLIKLLASLCDTFWIIVRWHCFCSAQQNSVCRYTVAITPIDICRHRECEHNILHLITRSARVQWVSWTLLNLCIYIVVMQHSKYTVQQIFYRKKPHCLRSEQVLFSCNINWTASAIDLL